MKNILMGTVVLFLFACSVLILQVSCSKSDAQPGIQQNAPQNTQANATTQLNKIVYGQFGGAQNGYWTANYDGTGQTLVNLTIPNGYSVSNQQAPVLSPDGTKLFFIAYHYSGSYERAIFSCNIDGSNVVQIVNCPNAGEIQLGGAY